MNGIVGASLALLLLLLIRMRVIAMRIIKRVFVKFPGWASGGGNWLCGNGFISGIYWAATDRHHRNVLHIFFLFLSMLLSANLFLYNFYFYFSFQWRFPFQESNWDRTI